MHINDYRCPISWQKKKSVQNDFGNCDWTQTKLLRTLRKMGDELDKTIRMKSDDEEVTFPRNSDHKPKPLYLSRICGWSKCLVGGYVSNIREGSWQRKNTVRSQICGHHLPKNKVRLYTSWSVFNRSKGLRPFTHTRQKGYPAYVSWSGSVKTGLITVKCHDGHNHKLLEKEYQHRRENRKLN